MVSAFAVPEIAVQQPSGNSLIDGSSSVDFGRVALGGSRDLTFTILNTGDSDLTGLLVTIDGVHASDFRVTTNPSAPVSGSGSTFFTVRFAPGATGSRIAALHLTSNDGDENPFDITLSGLGLASPEPILAPGDPIRGGAVESSNEFFEIGTVGTTAGANNWPGAEGPSLVIDRVKGGGNKFLNFAETNTGILVTPAAGASVISSMTLSVANDTVERDPATYMLYGTNVPVSGSGPFDLSEFSRISGGALDLPSARDTIADSAGNDFTVPVSTSLDFTSYILIFPTVKNSDVANSMQISEVQFHGSIRTPRAPEIAVEQPSETDLADGDANVDFGPQAVSGGSSVRTFTIRNTGNADLTGLGITIDGADASDFSVTANPAGPVSGPAGSTTFTVTFAPTASGERTAALHIASNDTDENPFDITLTGFGLAPEIVVQLPTGANLVDGSASVGFGSVAVGSSSQSSLVIRNTGNADLTGLGITIDGANASDFSVSLNPVPPVSGPTGSTTFRVNFAPTGSGARTAILHIASNDADENPFDIALTGSGLAPEIVVEQPSGTNLVDGSATVTFAAVLGTTSARTFAIRNPGNADLTGLGITIDGVNASDFRVTASPTAPVPGPTGSTSFTVTFTPAAIGTRTAVLHITSNDADENPFDISLLGTATPVPAPEIVVEQPSGTNLVDGSATVTFDGVQLGSNSARIFTIRNTGNANLTGLGITIDGPNASDFSITANPTAPVSGPTGSTNFTVTFTPAATGTRTAALHIASNDADENPFDIALTGSGLAPEIVVEQPAGTNLVDGSATVAFDGVQLGSNSARIFTIRNTGSADLTGLGITIDGPNASDFSITANPTAPVSGPTGSTNFTVTFTPAATGTRTAALHIASNDADENPFDIALTGSGLAPEIVVEQPSGTNLVDGSAAVAFDGVQLGTNSARIFTIRNTGNADLTGLGITIDGPNASDFSITANPTAPVSGPTGSTNFTVTFTPAATGTRTAALHITSNDADENPFDISLLGTATPVPAPEIAVEQPSGTNLVDGSATVTFDGVQLGSNSARIFTIRNTGNADLTGLGITIDGPNASDFSITANPTAPVSGPTGSTNFTVTFTPAATGTRTAALHIASNDADENPFDIALTGSGLAPEIVVEQPSGTNLVDGSAAVAFDGVQLGTNSARIFTIRNTGNADLTGLGITIDGPNASDFSITANPTAPVSGPTGSTNFTVTFTPAATGTRTAVLHITSNDADENPFDISLLGTATPVPAPEIAIEQPSGTNLVDGSATVTFDGVQLGSNSARIFTIRNTGNANLTGLGITIDGPNASDFSITANPTAPVSGPTSSTNFTVTFTPVATGTRTATLHIASNDADENPFDIALTGSGLAPEIVVEQPSGTNLVDGSATVTFDGVQLGSNSARIFTIRNTGNANLTGLGITIDGPNASDFSITANPTAPVSGPTGSTNFTVTFTPAATGTRTAALHIASNDADENPFDIALTGSGLAPEIVVEQPSGTNLVDGSATVAFDAVQLGSNSARIFTIRNTGNADLTGLGITIDGPNASDFSITANPTAPVSGPTGSTNFTVSFTPAAPGTRTAALHIASNDADENPFDIALTGSGLAPEIVVEQPSGTNLVDGSDSVTFGSVRVGISSARTFALRNTGDADLTGLGITIDGADATDFSVTTNPTAPLSGPTGTTDFTVTFTPAAIGTRTVVLHIASNDPDENPFDITLTGSAFLAPEIVVEQPSGADLVDGTASVLFGNVALGSNAARTFIIRNLGNANLTGLDITVNGTNASDFNVTTAPFAPVSGPTGSTAMVVTFTPAAAGTRTATLQIASNDADENSFDISLTGGLSAGDVWRQAFFGSPDAVGDAADLADPDCDGLPNLLEFATAQSPIQFSTPPVSLTLTPGFLEFTYSRSKAAMAEIDFTVESSDFLDGSWNAVRVNESILSDDGAVQQVRVTVPQSPNGQLFMRLRVAK